MASCSFPSSLLLIFLLILSLSCSIRVLSNSENGWRASSYPAGSSPTIPPPFASTQRALPAIKIDPSGKVYTTQILKQQLANELSLPLRDLRIVDPSFPSQIQATFMSRPRVILFCIENIKVVVQKDEALIFSPYQPEVQEFVPALQQQIAASMAGGESVAAGSANTRFEHIVIEAALNVVCTALFRRVRALSPAVASALNSLRAESRGLDVVQTQVDELLPLKNKLDELRKRVKEIKRAITEILNSDEDMAMMQLSSPSPYPNMNMGGYSASKMTPPQMITTARGGVVASSSTAPPSSSAAEQVDLSDSASSFDSIDSGAVSSSSSGSSGSGSGDSGTSEAEKGAESTYLATMNLEMLFENYLNEVEWIAAEVEDEIDEIRNTEENVVLQLDLLRNRILRFELLLSISSFIVTCGALVTGLFGMNLLSHLETNGAFFYIITAFLATSMSSAFLAFTRFGRKEKLF